MDALAQVKAALDAGLILAEDYEHAKAAFLRAQQIRSGFEAGLLTPDDADFVKRAFISSLDTLRTNHAIVAIATPPIAVAPAAAPAAPAASAPPTVRQDPPPCATIESEAVKVRMQEKANAPPLVAVEPKALPSPAKSPTPSRARPTLKKATSKPSSFGTSVSGVGVSEECAETFSLMKTRSAHRFITFKVDQADGKVVLDVKGEADASYESFTSALPVGDCRFAVYDYQYTNADNCIFDKIVFVMWSPDGSPMKNKMIYASSKDFFRQHLDGISVEMQVTDHDEITLQELHDKVASSITRN